MKNTIAKYSICDADIYNFDETGFMMGVISTGMVVTSSDGRAKAKTIQPGNREWVTVVQAVSSVRYTVPPYIIVAGKLTLIPGMTKLNSHPLGALASLKMAGQQMN